MSTRISIRHQIFCVFIVLTIWRISQLVNSTLRCSLSTSIILVFQISITATSFSTATSFKNDEKCSTSMIRSATTVCVFFFRGCPALKHSSVEWKHFTHRFQTSIHLKRFGTSIGRKSSMHQTNASDAFHHGSSFWCPYAKDLRRFSFTMDFLEWNRRN